MIKNNKKADIQISMSWIFMIIIGTVFIMLAYNIISKYQAIEQEKYEIEVKNTLRNILNRVGITTGNEQNKLEPINNIFQKSKVEIICEQGFPILSINDRLDSNNQYLKNYPVFMTYIEQDEVDFTYLAVENFKLPFKTTNLLALISTKNLIVFDNQSEITRVYLDGSFGKFTKSAYRNLNFIVKDFDSLDNFNDEIKDSRYNSVMFVGDYGREITSIDFNDIKSLTYNIQINRSSNKHGKLKYIDKDANEYEFDYTDYDENLAIVTMAIFSRPEVFNCSTHLLLENTKATYDFYIQKTNYLKNISNTIRICSPSLNHYSQVQKYDATLQDLKKIKYSINQSFNNSDLLPLISNLNTAQETLEEFNCAYIY